jgi:hypothetical protein
MRSPLGLHPFALLPGPGLGHLAALLAISLAGCGTAAPPAASEGASASPATPAAGDPAPAAASAPADAFLAGLRRHCGQAFAGKVLANQPPQPDDAFAGKPLIMHVRECGEAELKVPFHVGDDRSRTWVITRTATGLRLKHDHRHADGKPDAVTFYGGDTADAGTAQRQQFPVDAESIAMFERERMTASVTNTWALELEPSRRFLYELSRPGGRLFQVEFDLGAPVAPPPTPWGHPELP